MSILLLLAIVGTIYTICHNVVILVLCKRWGIGIEKFYIWIDTGFSLFKKNINGTEYSLGWFPLGGYVEIEGMQLEEEEELQPHYFLNASLFRRAIISLISPFLSIFIGLFFYNLAYPTLDFPTKKIILILLGFGIALPGMVLLFQQKIKQPIPNIIAYLVTIIPYAIFVYLGLYITLSNTIFHKHLIQFINMDFDLFQIQPNLSTFLKLMGYQGILSGVFNLLPIIGTSSSLFITTLYKSISKEEIAPRYYTIRAILSIPFFIGYAGWVIYYFGTLFLSYVAIF